MTPGRELRADAPGSPAEQRRAADALALLPELLPDLDPDALADLLTRATATGRIGGQAGIGAGEDQE
jgi:hypothetical protein